MTFQAKPSPARRTQTTHTRRSTTSPIQTSSPSRPPFKMPVSPSSPPTRPQSVQFTRQRNHSVTNTRKFNRARSPSAPSKSLPKLSVRTVPSPSGFVCALATPSGKCARTLRPDPIERYRTKGGNGEMENSRLTPS